MSESLGGLDNLVMGEAGEGASESNEQIRARAAAAAQRLQGVKRDETKANAFDKALAKIITDLPVDLISFIADMVDAELPSLTILALISIDCDPAARICNQHFSAPVPRSLGEVGENSSQPSFRTDLKNVGFDSIVTKKIDLWWEFIFKADQSSTTIRLANLRSNKKFVQKVSVGLAHLLKNFLEAHQITEFKKSELEKVLNARGQQIFQAEPLKVEKL